jgi:hypothetical protein
MQTTNGKHLEAKMAFQTPLLLKVIDAVNQPVDESVSPSKNDWWLVFVTYLWSLTLCPYGTEGFFLDLGGLHKYKEKGSSKHILIPI